MLPEGWSSFAFKLQFRGRTLEVNVNVDGAHVALLSGDALSVAVNGRTMDLA
jgi:maltose phosphorylase